MDRIAHWLPALGWAGLIFVTSSIPGNSYPDIGKVGLDKAVHFIVFGVLAATIYGGFRSRRKGEVPRVTRVKALVWAVVLTVAYGATDELHQRAVPGRFSDVRDLLADAAGGVCGALLACLREGWHARRRD